MTSYQAGMGFAKAKANLESLNRCTRPSARIHFVGAQKHGEASSC